jgi:hypothetical protein
VADFGRAGTLAPADARPRRQLGLALLAKQDDAGYRQTCRQLRRDFAETGDADTAAAVVTVGVLLPGAVPEGPETAALLRLARTAVERDPSRTDYREALGAALYRASRFDEAVRELSVAVEKQGQGGSVEAQLFLAMAHYRLERAGTGRTVALTGAGAVGLAAAPGGPGPLLATPTAAVALPAARGWLGRADARMGSAAGRPSWEERLRRQLLRAEAERLLMSPRP